MRILVVTATDKEIAPLVSQLAEKSNAGSRLKTYSHEQHEIDVLTTGVGMVATSAWCARVLTQSRYDLAFNFGVCGSFDSEIEPGQVVHVVSDCLAELGAEDDESFLTIQELNLPGADDFPFKSGRLSNLHPPTNATLNGLKTVSGITVNTVHGNERSIAEVAQRYQPDVESMEGAAFMYACLINEVVFAQVRAVSNIVERRNRNAWKMTEAIGKLGQVALKILEDA
jgi:futalosine hydrolase